MPAVRSKRAVSRPGRGVVFVVHGRDLRAAHSLRDHLRRLGVRVRLFEEVAARVRGAPMVASVVRSAISEAAVVIVLLTPDEQAVLYDPGKSRFLAEEARWQTRPNVVFEAGWAYGRNPEATLFVSLGDASFFSDIAGHVVTRLDTADGLFRLRSQLAKALGRELRQDRHDTFRNWDGRRPSFHDEMSELTLTLSNKDITCTKDGKHIEVSLMTTLREAVESRPTWNWSKRSPRELISLILGLRGRVVADEAFWWFVSFGVFRFSSIDYWGDRWTDAVDTCHFAPRGLSLINWIQRKGTRTRRRARRRVATSLRRSPDVA